MVELNVQEQPKKKMRRKIIGRNLSNKFSEHSIKLQKLEHGDKGTGLEKQVM